MFHLFNLISVRYLKQKDKNEYSKNLLKNLTMKTETIPAKDGNKAITYHPGGLHASTGTSLNKKIPASKKRAALNGAYGAKAKKQAQFAKNVFHTKM
jgi:hypothetical protein